MTKKKREISGVLRMTIKKVEAQNIVAFLSTERSSLGRFLCREKRHNASKSVFSTEIS